MELTMRDAERIIGCMPCASAIYQAGEKLTMLCYSPHLPALFECTDEEYRKRIGDDTYPLIVERDLPAFRKTIADAVGCKEADITYRAVHPRRGYVWMHALARHIGTMDGEPIALVVYLSAAIETEGHSDVLDGSRNFVYVVEPETHELLYANRTALESWGSGERRYAGLTCYDFIKGRDEVCPWCAIPQLDGDVTRGLMINDPEKGTYHIDDLKRVSWYGHDAVAIYTEDITESRREREHLLQQSKRLNAIVEGIPTGICVYRRAKDEITRIAANSVYREMMGMPSDSLLGMTWEQMSLRFHPDDVERVRHEAIELMDRDRKASCTFRKFVGDGDEEYIWLHMEGRLVRQSDGSDLAFYVYRDVTEQKEREERLSYTTKLYETSVEVAELFIWEYDIVTRRIVLMDNSFTQNHARELGIPNTLSVDAAEFSESFVVPSDREAFRKMFIALEDGVPHISCEITFANMPNQSPLIVRITYTNIFDGDGKPTKAYGVAQDITKQKLAEGRYYRDLEYIRASESPDLIAKGRHNLTRNRRIEHSTFSGNAIFFGDEESYDAMLVTFTDPVRDEEQRGKLKDILDRKNLLRRFEEGDTRFSCEYRRDKEGSPPLWLRTEVVTYRAPQSGDIEAFMYTYDETARFVERQVISKLTDLGYDYLGLIDAVSGTFSFYAGDAAMDIDVPEEGANYDEIVACKIAPRIPSDEREKMLRALTLETVIGHLAEQDVYSCIYELDDAEEGTFQKNAQFCYLDESHETLFFCRSDITAQVLTERERVERLNEALFSAEAANEMKTVFLANMSHDMRTPLNAVLGYTDLARETDDPEAIRGYLEKIGQSGNLLLQLINDTLDLSKIETGIAVLKPEPTDSGELLNEVLATLGPAMDEKGIEFDLQTSDSPLAMAKMDRMRMGEILLNVLNNAVKFTPPGGRVSLRVERLDERDGRAYERFTISDTGCGISEGFLPNIFEPFAQERTESNADVGGTGLGLAIVKRLVDLMDGKISVESEEGVGTTFTILLDYELADGSALAVAAPEAPAVDLSGRKVLLVEDNAMNTDIARRMVERWGMEVACAADGAEALEMFEASRPCGYDVVLMDLRMPRMDGYEATRRIRALGRSDAQAVPIIAMSADAYDEDVRLCLDTGMNAHVPKPVDPGRLYRALVQVLQVGRS